MFFLFSMLCTQSCTQKSAIPLFFGGILQFGLHFNENCSTNLDFLFKIKIHTLQLDWHHFKSTKPKLASVQAIFVRFKQF
jgi:hypothetical protein